MLFDLDVFGFGLAPLLLRSGCCFSGDELSRSALGLELMPNRPDVVGLDDDSLTTFSDESFFWLVLPLIRPETSFNEVLGEDVLVTVPLAPATTLVLTIVLETVLVVDTEEDVGALLQVKNRNKKKPKTQMLYVIDDFEDESIWCFYLGSSEVELIGSSCVVCAFEPFVSGSFALFD